MMWDEKASLSTTGLNNPIKIENTVQHQKEITELVEKLSDGNYLKFSSIQAIQQEKVDSYRDAVRNFNLLFALFGLLSMMISYFLLVTTFFNFLIEAQGYHYQEVYGVETGRSLPSSPRSALAGL